MERKPMSRQEAFVLVSDERDYQDALWNKSTTDTHGKHSPEEWLTYIIRYAEQAQDYVSFEANQVAVPKAMATMRKIAAMAIAAIEQIGAPSRGGLPTNEDYVRHGIVVKQ